MGLGYGNYVPSGLSDNLILGTYDTAQAFNTVVLGTNNAAYASYSTVSGYLSKTYGQYSFANGYYDETNGQSSIAFGEHDTANANYSLAMGYQNTAGQSAFNGIANIALGYQNKILGNYSVGMGYGNSVPTSATNAVVLGFHSTASGNYSTAIGNYVSTNTHSGSFIYGDSSTSVVTNNTANNQFMVRAAGGTIIYSNAGLTTGVTLTAGSGAWASVSDRNKKENFAAIDGEDVLSKIGAMPVTEWNYKAQPATQHHIGPMAQDFYVAFHLDGESDTTINSLDIDGINMAGIQALKKRTDELKAKVAEIDALKKELETLKQENVMLKTSVDGKVDASDIKQLKLQLEQLRNLMEQNGIRTEK